MENASKKFPYSEDFFGYQDENNALKPPIQQINKGNSMTYGYLSKFGSFLPQLEKNPAKEIAKRLSTVLHINPPCGAHLIA